MKYQNILFDIDNTLINSADLIAKLLKERAVREGVDMPIEEYRKRIGQPGEMILREFGVQNWQNVLARYLIEFNENMNELTYFVGVEQMLDDLLAMNLTVGVVTSKDRVQFDKEVSHFPIIAKMPIVTTADLTKNPKPSGEPITYTLERFNLARERTLYVGDSIFDMQASKNAGVDFVVAKWGALPNVDFNNAKYQAKTPNDIVGIVQ